MSIKENDFKRAKYNAFLDFQGQEDLIVYPNEDDSEKKQISEFAKFRNNNYNEIRKSGKFCDGLTAGYIKESLKNCDIILRIESSITRSKKLNGFATLKLLRNSKSLYIDTICTNKDIRGAGGYMIKLLSKISHMLSLDAIKLNSVTEAVPFYLKTEFECNPTCKMIRQIEGGSKINPIAKTKRKSHNKNKMRNKTSRMH